MPSCHGTVDTFVSTSHHFFFQSEKRTVVTLLRLSQFWPGYQIVSQPNACVTNCSMFESPVIYQAVQQRMLHYGQRRIERL